jgi:hypothetical protein
MNSEDYKKIASLVVPEGEKPAKTQRLLYLTKTSYEKFQGICKRRNKSASEVVDQLIEAYIQFAEAEEREQQITSGAALPRSGTE